MTRAAAEDTSRIVETMVATGAYEKTVEVRPGDVPDWIRLGALTALAHWITGSAATCAHDPHPDRPVPLLAAAWKPAVMACAACPHLLKLPRFSAADRTCDRCGRVTAGTDTDRMWPGAVQVGPMHWAYATCVDCRTAPDVRP